MSELRKQYETAVDRKNNPEEGSYTTYLFNKGLEKILKKENGGISLADFGYVDFR